MKRAVALLGLLSILVTACGDDAGDGADGTLTAAQREWCTFSDASEENAARFDLIFEAGLAGGVEMDAINAQADGRRLELLEQGLSPDEAVAQVSQELFDNEDFVEACALAYATHVPESG